MTFLSLLEMDSFTVFIALTHGRIVQYIAYNFHHTLNDTGISMSTDDKTWPEIDRRISKIRIDAEDHV